MRLVTNTIKAPFSQNIILNYKDLIAGNNLESEI